MFPPWLGKDQGDEGRAGKKGEGRGGGRGGGDHICPLFVFRDLMVRAIGTSRSFREPAKVICPPTSGGRWYRPIEKGRGKEERGGGKGRMVLLLHYLLTEKWMTQRTHSWRVGKRGGGGGRGGEKGGALCRSIGKIWKNIAKSARRSTRRWKERGLYSAGAKKKEGERGREKEGESMHTILII